MISLPLAKPRTSAWSGHSELCTTFLFSSTRPTRWRSRRPTTSRVSSKRAGNTKKCRPLPTKLTIHLVTVSQLLGKAPFKAGPPRGMHRTSALKGAILDNHPGEGVPSVWLILWDSVCGLRRFLQRIRPMAAGMDRQNYAEFFCRSALSWQALRKRFCSQKICQQELQLLMPRQHLRALFRDSSVWSVRPARVEA